MAQEEPEGHTGLPVCGCALSGVGGRWYASLHGALLHCRLLGSLGFPLAQGGPGLSQVLCFWPCSLHWLEAAFCWLADGNPVLEGSAERPRGRQHPQINEQEGCLLVLSAEKHT